MEMEIDDMPDRITEFFNGQRILVTDGTGFAGKALIEKFLRSVPNIGKIYVLIRSKKGKDPKLRLDEMLNGPLFDKVREQRGGMAELEKSVIAINGDTSLQKLGLSDEDRKMLCETVNFVYHAAITARFDEMLKTAVYLNTRATLELLNLAKEMKQLKLFVYINTAFSQTEEASSSDSSELSQPSSTKSFAAGNTLSEYRKRTKRGIHLYLKRLLDSHSFGRALRSEYKRNLRLSEESSILLCDIIASDLIVDEHSRLCNDDFSDLADEIVGEFANERRDTYYIPPVLKRVSEVGKSKHARGRLVDKFHNKLQRYRRMTGFTKSRNSITSSVEGKGKAELMTVLDAEVKKNLNWLEHNTDLNELIPHWQITSIARFNMLTKTDGSVSDVLRKYPILKDPVKGPQLITTDFKNLYHTDADDIYENWPLLFNKLWEECSKKNFPKSAEILKQHLLKPETNSRAKHFIQILLLPYLITPRASVNVKNGKKWKPSVEESQEGLAVFLTTSGDIDENRREKAKRMYPRGLTVQPYIVGVGNTVDSVTDFYVVVDDLKYHFQSALKALDVCFQLFFTWNADFPVETQQVWLFLQYALYNFRTERDITKAHVNKIIQAIGKKVPGDTVNDVRCG